MAIQCYLHIFTQLISLFAGNLPANKAAWLIGDQFLHDMFYTFQTMKRQPGAVENGRIPYLFEYYNVHPFMMNRDCGVRSGIARLQIALATELNRKTLTELPWFYSHHARLGYTKV